MSYGNKYCNSLGELECLLVFFDRWPQRKCKVTFENCLFYGTVLLPLSHGSTACILFSMVALMTAHLKDFVWMLEEF